MLASFSVSDIYLPFRYTMKLDIPRQFHSEELAKQVKEATEATEKVVRGALVTCVITNIFIARALTLIWPFINSL